MSRKSSFLAIAAAMLLIGSVAFAASAPFSDRPSASDLPVILADLPLLSATVAPPLESTVTPPAVDVDSAMGSGEGSREVVKPAVRDEDSDRNDDGESDSDKDDEKDSTDSRDGGDKKDTDSDGEESSKTDTVTAPAKE